jgi:hypothetical protein
LQETPTQATDHFSNYQFRQSSMTPLPSPAPNFTLTAIVTGRVINRATCAGRPLALLFHNQDGLETVRALQSAVRTRWNSPSTLLVGSVVNMQSIPRLLRGVAEGVMAGVYRDAARAVPAGQDPADYVLILPDGSGQVYTALGIHDGGKRPSVLVIDGAWQLHGPMSGPQLVADTLALLEGLLPPHSS